MSDFLSFMGTLGLAFVVATVTFQWIAVCLNIIMGGFDSRKEFLVHLIPWPILVVVKAFQLPWDEPIKYSYRMNK